MSVILLTHLFSKQIYTPILLNYPISFSRSVSGVSSPSLPQQELDAISVLSEAASDQNDAASDIEQLHRVIDAGVQVLSETIEEDLAHLHHLHVVSSVLSGGFRNDLERLFHVCIQEICS